MIAVEAVKKSLRELNAVHADFLDNLALLIENEGIDSSDAIRELRQASEHWRKAE